MDYHGARFVSAPLELSPGADPNLAITNRVTFGFTHAAINQVSESYVTIESPDEISVQTWQDGDSQIDVVSPVPATSGDDQTEQLAGFSWKRLNTCLSKMGIPTWVITAVGVACAGVCGVTAGAGCAPCIGFAAGLTGGVAATCVEYAIT